MRAIIVDDERLARQELKSLLEKYKVEVIAECANHIEAKNEIKNKNQMLYFLTFRCLRKMVLKYWKS